MQQNDVNNRTDTIPNLKHSSIGILSLVFCVLSLVPTIVNMFTGGLITKLLEVLHIGFLNVIAFCWLVVFLLAALILSIIDLRKPNRLKSLSKASLIISSIIIGVFLLLLVILLFTTTGNTYTAPNP